jgi:hypothetical protein
MRTQPPPPFSRARDSGDEFFTTRAKKWPQAPLFLPPNVAAARKMGLIKYGAPIRGMSRHSEKIAIFQIAIFSGDFW